MEFTDLQIIEGMPEHEYHQSSGLGPDQFITRSMLHCWHQSPAGFHMRYVQRHELAQFKGSEATKLGSTIEAMLLDEPAPYQLAPEEFLHDGEPLKWNLRTKACREFRDKQLALGIEYVPQAMIDKCNLMRNEVMLTPETRYFFAKRSDQQLTIRCKIDGLPCQVRIDLCKRGAWLADLKSVSKGRATWMTSVEEYGYDMQDAMYGDVYTAATGESLPFFFPVVRSTFPFNAYVERLPGFVTEVARKNYLAAISGIKQGLATGWDNITRGSGKTEIGFSHVPLWWMQKHDIEDGG